MDAHDGLLIPAAQKLYSALANLEKFSRHNDFFDNIASLDSFLSEYRNVTFVLQKSLAHTDYLQTYEKLREKYLIGKIGKWFKDKRNEVLKEHPFPLVKIIEVTIYDSANPTKLTTKQFSAEDDKEYSVLIEDIHKLLRNFPLGEVSFSVEYIYKEKDYEDNLFDKLFVGIEMILNFFAALKEEINDESKVFQNIMAKIKELDIYRQTTTDLFVEDLVYYKSTDKIEHGWRAELRMPNIKFALNKMPGVDMSLQTYGLDLNIDELHELFLKILHFYIFLYIHQRHIMTTILMVYNDMQANILSFDASIRSTFYRKIKEISEKIKEDKDIVSVFIIHECWTYPYKQEILYKNYEERVATENPKSTFAGHMINEKLEVHSYHFEEEKLKSREYIINNINETVKTKLTTPPIFLTPIYNAFSSRRSYL